MDNHHFCRARLKLARMDAKEANIKLPPISSTMMFPDNYAVFAGNDYYEYNSCCAFDARADCIYELIDLELKNRNTNDL